MSRASTSYPVPPNSVYVWRGSRPATLSYDGFAAFLSTVFVPACVLLQPPIGLRVPPIYGTTGREARGGPGPDRAYVLAHAHGS